MNKLSEKKPNQKHRCIVQIEKVIEKGKKDKMPTSLQKILEMLSEQAQLTVPIPTMTGSQNQDSSSSVKKTVLHSLNRCLTHGGLETLTFGFFELHLLNSCKKTNFPKQEKILGIFDVTASGSCKNCLVFGEKAMYYYSSKGKGAIEYSDLKSRILTVKKEENILMIDDHVIYCFSSDRFDALVKVVELVKSSLEANDEEPLSSSSEIKKSKKSKKEKKVMEKNEQTSVSPGKAETPDSSNKNETAVGQLISFDSFLVVK